ncbi:MAG: hypothetical protein AVDCRST_MAG30-252, partial [uncultured Solirubrobacteraceae bacterium]
APRPRSRLARRRPRDHGARDGAAPRPPRRLRPAVRLAVPRAGGHRRRRAPRGGAVGPVTM